MSDGISYHTSFECETKEEAVKLMEAVFEINERLGIPNGGGENEPSHVLTAAVGGERGMSIDVASESKDAFRALSAELAVAGGMGHLAAVAHTAAEARPLTDWEQSTLDPDMRIYVDVFKNLRIEDFLDEAGMHNEYELEVKLPTEGLAEALSRDLADKKEMGLSVYQENTNLTVFGSEDRASLVDVFHILENEEVSLSCKITNAYFEGGNLTVIADDVIPIADVPVAFADRDSASEISPFTAAPADTEKMSSRRLADECGDARDGRYALLSVWCKDDEVAEMLGFATENQCIQAEYEMGQMDTWKLELDDDKFQIYYGEWTPAFWKETAETLGRVCGLYQPDAMQVRIEDADWIDVINRQLKEDGSEYRLEHTKVDFPGAQYDAVQVMFARDFGNSIVIPKSTLEDGLYRAVEYLEGLVAEYSGLGFDKEGITDRKIRLEDSREKLCSNPDDRNVYDHDFSSYRVIFRNLDSFEADMIRSAVDDCDLWKAGDRNEPGTLGSVMPVVESSADGRVVTVASTDPEVAAVLGNELAFKGFDCVVSGAYPIIAADSELVLEAVPRPDVRVEMSETGYRAKPDGTVAQKQTESRSQDLVNGQEVYSGVHVYRDYNDLTAQVAFADCVPAPDIGPDAMVPIDTKRMSLGEFLEKHGDTRDGRYAMIQVTCKNANAADHLDFELERQYAELHPDVNTNVCDMGRMWTPNMEDEYELFYGRWTPSFLENTAESLQNVADLCGIDSVQIRINNTNVENLINLQLEEDGSEYRLAHMDIDLPDKPQRIFAQIVRGENDDSGTIIPMSALEAKGVDRGIEYLEELDREYDHFNFDQDGIGNGKISLEDSREKLCSGLGGRNAYDHDFSRYRVVFRNVNPLEADAIRDAIDCCDKAMLRMRDNDVNGWKITVLSIDPEAATVLGSEMKSRGVECTVSGAYTFAVDNELVLEAVTHHGNSMEMSGADYRTKPNGSLTQTSEPRLESFASAVEREQAEVRKQQPTAPQRKNGVERSHGMDVAM